MTRSTTEWIGKTDDSAIPPRVKLRIWQRDKGTCQNCQRRILASDTWECDHTIPLIAGGGNRESNLQVLCGWCHKAKTKADVADKATVYAKKLKHVGIKKTKGRPLLGSKASGWKRKMDGSWVRRDERS